MTGSPGIYTAGGARKYITAAERDRFLAEAAKAELPFFLLCLLYCLTGCRVSEALAVTGQSVDCDEQAIRFRTLKRRAVVWRSVPLPESVLAALRFIDPGDNAPLFPYSRSTVWRRVRRLMIRAGIRHAQATPKALRHYFGVFADQQAIPQPLLKRWMGHARDQSTAIYRDAVNDEERRLAERLCWFPGSQMPLSLYSFAGNGDERPCQISPQRG